jgi:tetratricopeptide (TPR) repeat protein
VGSLPESYPAAAVQAAAERADELAIAAMEAAEQGRLDEAERVAHQALGLAEQLGEGPDRHRCLARALRPLGTAERARGRYREAERTFTRALEHASAAFGSASIEVAELHNDLGMTFKYVGRFNEAEAAYDRARVILEGLPDVDPEDLAALFHNLGGLAHARGDFETAEPLARHAVEIRSRSLGRRAPATLIDRSAHAAILAGLGRSDEAEASLRELLGDLEVTVGPDHPEVAVALNNLAALLQARGAMAEAETLYRRVIAIKEAAFGDDSPTLAVPLNNLATVLRSQGADAGAAGLYQRATELLEGSVPDDHPHLLAIRRNAGRLGGGSFETAVALDAPEVIGGGR